MSTYFSGGSHGLGKTLGVELSFVFVDWERRQVAVVRAGRLLSTTGSSRGMTVSILNALESPCCRFILCMTKIPSWR